MALQKLTVIDPLIVTQMASMLPRYNAEDIQDHFGISLNTWSKLRKGEAIRDSVAARLLGRIEP